MIIVYHSPGLVCPSSWSTVGSATKVNPTSRSIPGAYNQSITIPRNSYLGFEPGLEAFLAALDPREIAAVCYRRFALLPLTDVSVERRAKSIFLVPIQPWVVPAALHSPVRSLHRPSAASVGFHLAMWVLYLAHGLSAGRL